MFLLQIYGSLPVWAWLLIAALAVVALAVLITPTIRMLRRRRLARITSLAGFANDSDQDIFYSEIDAWQRQLGFCRLYDEEKSPLKYFNCKRLVQKAVWR